MCKYLNEKIAFYGNLLKRIIKTLFFFLKKTVFNLGAFYVFGKTKISSNFAH